MSTVEELLARDIATVTRGIVVTDSELLEARTELNERIAHTHLGIRRVTVAAAAALVLLAGAVAGLLNLGADNRASQPANQGRDSSDSYADFLTGKAPTPELIAGIWRVDNGKTLIDFHSNHDVRFDEQGTLFSQPTTRGTYVIAGDLITVTITQDAQPSCVGTVVALRASAPSVGVLRFAPSRTSAGPCAVMPAGRGELHQLLPTRNKDLADLVLSKDVGWLPLTDKTTLYGVWMAEGGNFLLEIDPGGTYYMADANWGDVSEVGAWSLRGSRLTLTSSANSAECNAGDQLVLGAVQQENPNTVAFRGTVEKNTCGAHWTPAAWILLPNHTTS